MNKTPNNETEKTVSAPKLRLYVRPLIVIAILLLAVVAWTVWPRHSERILVAGDRQYQLETVTTAEAMVQGLGGRPSLDKDAGMLFAYEQSAPNRCFWMKGMRFSIDIIWLDNSKKVVHIEPDVSPSTYPRDFCAPTSSQYVIELNAGEAERARIGVGQTLQF